MIQKSSDESPSALAGGFVLPKTGFLSRLYIHGDFTEFLGSQYIPKPSKTNIKKKTKKEKKRAKKNRNHRA
jgi:hypothetical protein